MTTVAASSSANAPARSRADDLREGGTWTLRQRVKNGLIAAALRVALAALAPLPSAALQVFGKAIGLLALLAFGRARRTALANVAIAFPEMTPSARRKLVRRVYATLGASLGDALASLAPRPRALLPLPIDAASLALLTEGQGGVVFASAHLGPWEQVAKSLVAHGVPLTVIAREAYDPRLAFVYERLRRGVGAIYRGAPGAATRIVRTLRGGGVLGVPMDLRSRVPSIEVPFLGRSAPTPVGPARIALRTGARVVVGTVAPSHDGTLLITCSAIASNDLADLPEREGERLLTARINAEISARILALPASWVWMHDRFGAAIPVD